MKNRFRISCCNLGIFKDNGLPVLLILLASIVYFIPYLNFEKTLVPYDLLTFFSPWHALEVDPPQNMAVADVIRMYVPWKMLYRRALLSGEIPFWNPYNFSGVPLMANGLSQVFYPPCLINVLMGGEIGYTIFLSIHQVFTGLGMFFLLRRFRLSPPSATAGSVTWMLCGYMTVWLGWFSIIATLAWLPWLFLTTDWLISSGDKKAMGGLALVVGLSLLAGHPNYAYYNFLSIGAYATFCLISVKISWFIRLKRFGQFLVGSMLGFLLASVQIFPLLEYASLSPRGSISIDQLLGSALPFRHLITLIIPNFFGDVNHYWGAGNYVEFTGYVGLASFVLILFCFLHPDFIKRKTLIFFILLAIVVLYLATGGWLNRPLSLIPGYTSFRALQRLLSIWSFSAAVLTAWGIETLLHSVSWRRTFLKCLCLFIIVMSFLGLLNLEKLSSFLAQQYRVEPLDRGLLQRPLVVFAITGFAALLLLFIHTIRTSWTRIFYFFPSLIILIDLILFAREYLPVVDTEMRYPITPGIAYLISNRDEGRLIRFGSGPLESPLIPNTGLVYGLEDIDGIGSFSLVNYNRLIGLAESERVYYAASYNTLGNLRKMESLDSPILDLIGATFLISEEALPDKESYQVECDQVVGEILAGEEIGQTFHVEGDELFRVDLSLATFARPNEGFVEIVLRTDPSADTAITSEIVDVSTIADNRYFEFTFPPISTENRRDFYIGIKSLDGQPGNAITVWSNSQNVYQGGAFWRDGERTDGDLCFQAYTKEIVDGWKHTYAGSDMVIYRNTQSLPLAFIVGEVHDVRDENARQDVLASQTFDPLHQAILLDTNDVQTDVDVRGEVHILERTLTKLILEVTVNSPSNTGGLLVIRQNDYPGWRAWVDEERVEILIVNLTYQGLFLKDGTHEVKMQFIPKFFYVEIALSTMSVLMIFLLFFPKTRKWIKS
jgi:hypothetical protein